MTNKETMSFKLLLFRDEAYPDSYIAETFPEKVKALVPEAELDRYATQLHSLTHGRGTYRQKFHAYQEAPPEVTAKVVEAHKKELEVAEKK